jgi:hypothetical protein
MKRWLSGAALLAVLVGCASDGDGTPAATGGVPAGSGGATGGTPGATGGAGGTTGGTATATGGAGGVTIPTPTGSVGTSISCGQNVECTGGDVCCEGLIDASCVSGFNACACSLEGRCTAMGCDAPSDCPGGHCCALANPRQSPGYVATSCKTECGTGERILCLTDDDCTGTDQCSNGSRFDWCF